jgi:hypothetical protein
LVQEEVLPMTRQAAQALTPAVVEFCVSTTIFLTIQVVQVSEALARPELQ